MSAVKNPLAQLSDEALVEEHSRSGANSHYVSEMLRRHMKASVDLGDKIWWLNLWLLLFTVAIAGMTGVLVWLTLRAPK
jgi:hypothetical protein